MKLAVFSTNPYDRDSLTAANAAAGHEIEFLSVRLDHRTAPLARGFDAVCPFVNDRVDSAAISVLKAGGTRLIVLRSAGFNHVDIAAATQAGLTVLRVPAYSPHAIAEHTIALILTLNRKIHKASNRVHELNFSLDGLMGFDLFGKTAGIVGTGKIGIIVARILSGFGCRVLAFDTRPSDECRRMGASYVGLDELLAQSDIVTLHCPLTPQTRHLINERTLATMRPGAMLVNTSRGGVVDTRAVIATLKSGHLGSFAIDVYEEEGDLFFRDLSNQVVSDDVFARLLTFPNVLITAHQAFFTREAVRSIAETTIANVSDFAAGSVRDENRVTLKMIAG